MPFRVCSCPHRFPLCACVQGVGLTEQAVRDRSRLLSAQAGWPGRIDPVEAERILARYRATGPTVKQDIPGWLALPRIKPALESQGHDCGCGQGRA